MGFLRNSDKIMFNIRKYFIILVEKVKLRRR